MVVFDGTDEVVFVLVGVVFLEGEGVVGEPEVLFVELVVEVDLGSGVGVDGVDFVDLFEFFVDVGVDVGGEGVFGLQPFVLEQGHVGVVLDETDQVLPVFPPFL